MQGLPGSGSRVCESCDYLRSRSDATPTTLTPPEVEEFLRSSKWAPSSSFLLLVVPLLFFPSFRQVPGHLGASRARVPALLRPGTLRGAPGPKQPQEEEGQGQKEGQRRAKKNPEPRLSQSLLRVFVRCVNEGRCLLMRRTPWFAPEASVSAGGALRRRSD